MAFGDTLRPVFADDRCRRRSPLKPHTLRKQVGLAPQIKDGHEVPIEREVRARRQLPFGAGVLDARRDAHEVVGAPGRGPRVSLHEPAGDLRRRDARLGLRLALDEAGLVLRLIGLKFPLLILERVLRPGVMRLRVQNLPLSMIKPGFRAPAAPDRSPAPRAAATPISADISVQVQLCAARQSSQRPQQGAVVGLDDRDGLSVSRPEPKTNRREFRVELGLASGFAERPRNHLPQPWQIEPGALEALVIRLAEGRWMISRCKLTDCGGSFCIAFALQEAVIGGCCGSTGRVESDPSTTPATFQTLPAK